MTGTIYKITNVLNKKFYIGSSIRFTYRKKQHIYDLRKNTHCNRYLQNAWNKYGERNFIFEIIEDNISEKDLLEREQYYLDFLKPEYNILKETKQHLNRYKLTKEQVDKAVSKNTGLKRSPMSKLRMSISAKINRALNPRKFSEIIKLKMQNVQKKLKGKSILQYTLDDTFIQRWESAGDIFRKFGYKRQNISKCCNGKRPRAYGYKWKFE